MKKGFSLVLCATMLGAMLAGCQQSSSGSAASDSSNAAASGSAVSEETAGITYPLEGNVKLSLAVSEYSQITAVCAWKDTPFVKEWEKETGVTLEISHPSDFALLFASGDLPDLIQYNFNSYNGGSSQAIKDKVVYPINDLLEEYAPDLNEVLKSHDIWKKSVTTENGDIVGFPFIRGDEYLQTFQGLIIRQDWLDKLNMEQPQTPDELYDVLKAFKEQLGATVPFSLTVGRLRDLAVANGMITSPFGLVKGNFYQKDGKVYNGYYQQQYKDVLTWLNKLYTDGLLDPSFATIDDNTMNANIMNGAAGLTVGYVGGGIGVYMSTMESKNPDFSVIGIKSLVAKDGDKAMCSQYENAVTGDSTVITSSCKNKEIAAEFLNYCYTEPGYQLANFGIEGESFNYVNSYPTFTDLITQNPDGLTMQQAMAQYCRSWNGGPFIQAREYMEQYASRPQQKESITAWMDSDAEKYTMPNVNISQEDSSEYSKLSSDINTYISEMFVKFVSGLEPLDNFDTYLSTLKEMGMDKMIEMQQKALDEFNAR